MDALLMKRRRTFSPGRNSPVQLAAGGRPLMRKVYVAPVTSMMSPGPIRIQPHFHRSEIVGPHPFFRASAKKVPIDRWRKL